jgi:hypothetical protein
MSVVLLLYHMSLLSCQVAALLLHTTSVGLKLLYCMSASNSGIVPLP